MDWNLFWLFVIFNIINVIIQTIKSIATIKCSKGIAALVNAIAYGLYTYIVVLTVCDLPLWLKVVVVGGANLIGVYIVKLIEEKGRKDKLWKVEMACPLIHSDDMHKLLTEYNIPHNFTYVGKWVMFNCYCMTQNDTGIVTDLGSKKECKFSAYESKTLDI